MISRTAFLKNVPKLGKHGIMVYPLTHINLTKHFTTLHSITHSEFRSYVYGITPYMYTYMYVYIYN